ncbi:UDP-glucuronic acid decarboxylase family protein [Aliivibrio sp. S2MY1]|uniref:UDP-glucuronic acid decarboxylase family protein n=1 Tax=Aliivibrio sp. S2MY1 TaxID=3028423 RepID=UPI0023784F0D|nr:UDP-glucuronic acid decarboxylase family protein [Aliivibrio sp. S2MY1]MDD9199154.1 SDR family oxidoreductase [Aliivibrio sp. S2MY1]
MRILVAGGAGFIGSHLCENLIQQGHFVVCIDSLITGSKHNIEHLFNNNFTFIEHDIVNTINMDDIDQVYNLACPASPNKYQKDPISTIDTNVIGTKNLLELAKRNRARFLLASTSEVYGDPQQHPQREDYFGNVNTFGPRACYDEGKRCAETLSYEYSRMYGVETRIARIFNTYGPKMQVDDGRVVSNFIVGALTKHEICIYGDGSQTRCFCYIDDMVEGLVSLMGSDCKTPVNLGSDHEVTVNELANRVNAIFQQEINVVWQSIPQDDPMKRKPDLSKARRELNWNIATPLDMGLEKTAEYFQGQIVSHD